MMNQTNKKTPPWLLPALLVFGAVIGFGIGGLFGEHWSKGDWPIFTGFFNLIGDLFMNLLKMIVLPLVVCSMIVGMSSIKAQSKVGKIFSITFLYYFATTFLAVLLGLSVVSIIQPGVGAGVEFAYDPNISQKLAWYDALFRLVLSLAPSNLFQAAAEGKILGLLVFALIFGGLLTRLGERGERVIEIIDTINEALMIFVRWVVWAAPIGIIGLVAARVGAAGGAGAIQDELQRLALYFITVVLGLFIHGGVILPSLLFFFAKLNPFRHGAHFAEAVLTAFSTASSAATLPLTIQNAEKKARLSPKTSRFVLPLGATINMDGTALYEAVAAIFIAQAYGIDLSGAQMLVIVLTATLAAVGAAAIPQAGLVTMVMVLTAVNLPVEGIGILLSVDWLLDRFRTAVNVWGDSIGAAIVDERFSDETNTNRLPEK